MINPDALEAGPYPKILPSENDCFHVGWCSHSMQVSSKMCQ